MNILIVDDEKMEVEIVKKMIDKERLSYSSLYSAFSMAEAMDILKKYPIAVVICDIEMPQGSGHDLIRWIREQEMETEVIYLTGHAEFSYATTALRLGAVDYLLKPVGKEDLMAALEKAVHNLPDNYEKQNNLNAEQIVGKVKEYVKDNCDKDISRAEVSRLFFIHPDYLSHIFKEYSGETFQDYVIKVRINKGKRLLNYTDLSISNVATQTGYSNTAYFAKHFKRETGMTPKEYRKYVRESL